jgi:hypothetical protein
VKESVILKSTHITTPTMGKIRTMDESTDKKSEANLKDPVTLFE